MMKDISSSVMSPSWMKHVQIAIICSIALGIIMCAGYKASQASMTHDESSTYLNLIEGSTLNLWSCHRNPVCWTTANNHLLNTLLMRWSVRIIGPMEFALRLPNLLMLVVYLLSMILFLKDTVRTSAEAVFGVTLLTCNPFVLDFFALARGYGMGLGLMTLSIYAMWRYIRQGRGGFCVLAFAAATASVFANLTYIAYVVALTCTVFLLIVLPMIRRPRKQIAGVVPLSMACCLILLFAYFYRPILILIGLGEFEYGAPSLWESWKGFTRDSLYGVMWIGERTFDVVSIGSTLILGLCVITAWTPSLHEDKKTETEFGRFLSVLFLALIAFFVFSHVFTGASYPTGRKTIILYSPAALLVYAVMRRGIPIARIWVQMIMAALGILLVVHFVRTYNCHSYREWWYDASTKEMIHYVATKSSPGDTISLGVEWIFHPSTGFYVQTLHLPVALAPYSKEISKDSPVEYYYAHPDQAKSLEPDFTLEKNFEGRLLMKRVGAVSGER
ncbi:MAG TPA: hypothetical protein VI603_06165 [Saprospiraceae bacterium]|nr:hypothetical protein [Saprospiraceae bacterium]